MDPAQLILWLKLLSTGMELIGNLKLSTGREPTAEEEAEIIVERDRLNAAWAKLAPTNGGDA